MKKMIEWLSNPSGINFTLCLNTKKLNKETKRCEDKERSFCNNDPDFLNSPEKDERVHTGIDARTGTAAVEDGLLFMSAGLDLSTTQNGEGIQMAARIETDNAFEKMIGNLDEVHPFGGERRLAQWIVTDEPIGWSCPAEIPSKITELDSCKIRMVLATPAIFSNGWLPGWLDPKTLEGIPPGAEDDKKLKLISACLDLWKPISGWSAEAKSRGPKAIRRMVPAGAVYFFKARMQQLQVVWQKAIGLSRLATNHKTARRIWLGNLGNLG